MNSSKIYEALKEYQLNVLWAPPSQMEVLAHRLDLQLPEKQIILVASTVAALPLKVQEIVIDNIQFFSGRSCEFTIDMLEPDKRHVIILCPCNLGMFTVAHEIAHAYLGDSEAVANQQAKKWLGKAGSAC